MIKITNDMLLNALAQFAPKPIQKLLTERTEALHVISEAQSAVKGTEYALAERLQMDVYEERAKAKAAMQADWKDGREYRRANREADREAKSSSNTVVE